jgi:hypothetical protein
MRGNEFVVSFFFLRQIVYFLKKEKIDPGGEKEIERS